MKKSCTLLALMLLGACAPEFTEPWEVKVPRLVAGRVEVDGDADKTRSKPRPGESFAIRLFTSTPREPETALSKRYDAQLELCLGVLLPNGQLACGALPGLPPSITFAGEPEVVSLDELRFSGLSVPAELATLELPPPFEEIDRIALFGAVCIDGKVERIQGKEVNDDPLNELFRCTENKGAEFQEPLLFTLSVLVDLERPGDANKHPSFACEASEGSRDACRAGVEIEGEETIPGPFVLALPKEPGKNQRKVIPWEPLASAAPLPWTDCRQSGLPRVGLGDDAYVIRVRFDAADRENYEYESEQYGKTVLLEAREELIVSHSLTDLGGELERYFSVIEADVADDQAALELEYTPPARDSSAANDLSEGGRLVRFYFAVRDERGGVDYTTRELCLVP